GITSVSASDTQHLTARKILGNRQPRVDGRTCMNSFGCYDWPAVPVGLPRRRRAVVRPECQIGGVPGILRKGVVNGQKRSGTIERERLDSTIERVVSLAPVRS